MTKERYHRTLLAENPWAKSNEMRILMNEYHYRMMMMVRLFYMTKYQHIHHEQSGIVDHKDL